MAATDPTGGAGSRRYFSGPESQDARGAPGSRDQGRLATRGGTDRPETGAKDQPRDASGVNPLGAIDPEMVYLKPGDQGG